MHIEVSPKIKRWALPIAALFILVGGGVTASALALESQDESSSGVQASDIEDLQTDVAEIRAQLSEALAALEEISAGQPSATEIDGMSEEIATIDSKVEEALATLEQLSQDQVTSADLDELKGEVDAIMVELNQDSPPPTDPGANPAPTATPGPVVAKLEAGAVVEYEGYRLTVDKTDAISNSGAHGPLFIIENLAGDLGTAYKFADVAVTDVNGSLCLPNIFSGPGNPVDWDLVEMSRGEKLSFGVSWECVDDAKASTLKFDDVVIFEMD